MTLATKAIGNGKELKPKQEDDLRNAIEATRKLLGRMMIRRGTSTLWFGQLAVPMSHHEHLDFYVTVSDCYAALPSRCMRVCGLAFGLMVSYLSFCPQARSRFVYGTGL